MLVVDEERWRERKEWQRLAGGLPSETWDGWVMSGGDVSGNGCSPTSKAEEKIWFVSYTWKIASITGGTVIVSRRGLAATEQAEQSEWKESRRSWTVRWWGDCRQMLELKQVPDEVNCTHDTQGQTERQGGLSWDSWSPEDESSWLVIPCLTWSYNATMTVTFLVFNNHCPCVSLSVGMFPFIPLQC